MARLVADEEVDFCRPAADRRSLGGHSERGVGAELGVALREAGVAVSFGREQRLIRCVELVSCPRNLGFSGGDRSGVRFECSPLIALFNRDVVVRTDSFQDLPATALRTDMEVCMSRILSVGHGREAFGSLVLPRRKGLRLR